jgi:hypothetical protein
MTRIGLRALVTNSRELLGRDVRSGFLRAVGNARADEEEIEPARCLQQLTRRRGGGGFDDAEQAGAVGLEWRHGKADDLGLVVDAA